MAGSWKQWTNIWSLDSHTKISHQLTFTYSHTKEQPVLQKYLKVDGKIIGVSEPKKYRDLFSINLNILCFSSLLGVSHAEELQYLFPIAEGLFISALPTKEDNEIRKGITQLWVDFARTG